MREADRRKDAFIATLAHELRNPLAPVRNAVQILQLQAAANPGSQRASDIIARQVGVMARLIDDLMDVSRINRGHIELKREPVDLSRVIELAVEATRPHITENGHELLVQLPDSPIVLEADITRLSQVFVNLLTNAAKYTDRGGHIELVVQRERRRGRGHRAGTTASAFPSEQLQQRLRDVCAGRGRDVAIARRARDRFVAGQAPRRTARRPRRGAQCRTRAGAARSPSRCRCR